MSTEINIQQITVEIAVTGMRGPSGAANVTNIAVNTAIQSDPAATRSALALGSAATKDASDFDANGAASSAVATHDAAANPHPQYLLVSNLPAIPSVPADIGAATAAQGAKADTAVQPGDLGSMAYAADATSDGVARVRRDGAWDTAGLVPVNSQSGTSYTLLASDLGKDIVCTNAGAVAIIVPANSTVPFPVGTIIAYSQGGAGTVNLTAASGVTLSAANGTATVAQHDQRILQKLATDTWRVL